MTVENPLTSPVTSIDAKSLASAIEHTRSIQCGDLWAELVVRLATDSPSLSRALIDQYGIATLLMPLPEPAVVHRMVGVSVECFRVDVPGAVLLACADPWLMANEGAWLRQSLPHARWAIADKAGMQELRQLSAMAQPGNSSPKPSSGGPSASAEPEGQVVRFVAQAIERGHAEGASDIHFETDRQGIGVKYRIDGVMLAGPVLRDPQRSEEVISRIKVMAQLDITERRRPQDGRIHWSAGASNEGIDLRVSVMPSLLGEDAVLRLLDKSQLRAGRAGISLDTLGFSTQSANDIRQLSQRPHGMLLVTGPTGSGKTTTVYGALSEVNDGLGKIITIEDPVEYELSGVLQIPVNEQKGLTFATGLRSILRHDPDKILVGEIRDAETARIAVQSALTGHLVFTTVHANSLLDVLGRFEHFDIDPFSLASALNGVVVQRLLRRLCPHCLQWRAPSAEDKTALMALSIDLPERVPVACGCAQCRESGYRGRMVVAEVHKLDDTVKDLMVQRSSIAQLRAHMGGGAAQLLLQQAVREVSAGKTSLEEVRRVVGWT